MKKGHPRTPDLLRIVVGTEFIPLRKRIYPETQPQGFTLKGYSYNY
jgi:hypothetical protein